MSLYRIRGKKGDILGSKKLLYIIWILDLGDKEWERICNLYFSLFLSKNHIAFFLTTRDLRENKYLKKAGVGWVVPGGLRSWTLFCVCFPNSLVRSHSSSKNVVPPSIPGFLFPLSLRVFGSVPLWHLYPFLFFCCATWTGAISSGEKEAGSGPDLHQPRPQNYLISLWLFMTQLF